MNFKKLITTNPTFRRIVTEEAKRFAKIIKEYEEKQHVNENHVVLPLIRGIVSMIHDNERFINSADVKKMVVQELGIADDDVDSIRTALFDLLKSNPTEIYPLWKRVSNELMSKNPADKPSSVTSDVNPRQTTGGEPSRNRDWRGGSWTGD